MRTGVVVEHDRTSSVDQCRLLLTQFPVHFVDFKIFCEMVYRKDKDTSKGVLELIGCEGGRLFRGVPSTHIHTGVTNSRCLKAYTILRLVRHSFSSLSNVHQIAHHGTREKDFYVLIRKQPTSSVCRANQCNKISFAIHTLTFRR